ncbi:hypothetical protein PRIPAC_80887, partial [Pristionchus pacificus]|uniref:Uncharacterized protein n=1 Tax=Pristionchus pacificus TaxID=54126 RepID=A0A2A6BWB4_PRIPA
MSSRTRAYQRAMINSLVMQSLCWLFICIPVVVWLASVITEKIPHEVTLVAFATTQLLTIIVAARQRGHNDRQLADLPGDSPQVHSISTDARTIGAQQFGQGYSTAITMIL